MNQDALGEQPVLAVNQEDVVMEDLPGTSFDGDSKLQVRGFSENNETSPTKLRRSERAIKDAISKSLNQLMTAADNAIARHVRLGPARDEIKNEITNNIPTVVEEISSILAMEGLNRPMRTALEKLKLTETSKLRDFVNDSLEDSKTINYLIRLLNCDRSKVIEMVQKQLDVSEILERKLMEQHNYLCTLQSDAANAEKRIEELKRELASKEAALLRVSADPSKVNGGKENDLPNAVFEDEWEKMSQIMEDVNVGRTFTQHEHLQSSRPEGRQRPQARRPERADPDEAHHDRSAKTQSEYSYNSSERSESMRGNSTEKILLSMVRAQTLSPLQEFSGTSENKWRAFAKAFTLRYPEDVWSVSDLCAMLIEKVSGPAKDVLLSEGVDKGKWEQPFQDLIERVAGSLAKGGKAEAMEALSKLGALKKRPGQSVRLFCIELERLSEKAHMQAQPENLSFIRADCLLRQLADWNDAYALTAAMDESQPGKEYEAVKQVALRLERNMELKGLLKAGNSPTSSTTSKWRELKGSESGERKFNKWVVNGSTEKRTAQRSQTDSKNGYNKQEQQNGTQTSVTTGEGSQTVKCFNCNGFGHTSRNCRIPRQNVKPQTNNGHSSVKSAQKVDSAESADLQRFTNIQMELPARVVTLLGNCNSIEVASEGDATSTTKLVGKKMTSEARVFGVRCEALLDSGSQLTILSTGVLKKAIKNGVNVDALIQKEIPIDQGIDVKDASGNRMKFTGAIVSEVGLSCSNASKPVAMLVTQSEDDWIILGTNAFEDFGISLEIKPIVNKIAEEAICENKDYATKCAAVMKERVVIPPKGSAFVKIGGARPKETMTCWAKEATINTGVVFTDDYGVAMVASTNESDEPVVLQEGQIVGEWSNNKIRTIYSEDTADMLDQQPEITVERDSGERDALLVEKLMENRDNQPLSQRWKELIYEFHDVFTLYDHELTRTNLVQHDVDTGDNKPIKQKCRPVPHGVKTKFMEILRGLLERGIIEPSSSEWASPVVLVEKKDKTLRLCIDYRALNKVIKQDSYPLPRIDEILQNLAGKRYFSTLDMASGYWQIGLTETAKEKSAFVTSEGLFQFRVLPFGLSTSPATFQRLMDHVLSGLKGDKVFVYIDDILICTETEDEHFDTLREVLMRFRKAQLCLKATKCTLLVNKVPFLGHVIDENGVHTNAEKVKALLNVPVPRCLADLRTFLGAASYYRKFILGFSKIAKPLYNLTSPKNAWTWTDIEQTAFDELKKRLSSAPVLAQPNVEAARAGTKPYIIYTDASGTGVGAVLCQEGKDGFLHPIYFVSKSLTIAESRYTVTDLEGLAIVFALNKFHYFIYGMSVIVRTDHLPLTALFNRQNMSNRVLRWAVELQRYDVKIEYVKGTANAVADALSRGAVQLNDDQDIAGGTVKVVAQAQTYESEFILLLKKEPGYTQLVEAVKKGDRTLRIPLENSGKKYSSAEFFINNGLLWTSNEKGEVVKVVPKCMRKSLFLEAHGGTWSGHFNAKRVLRRLSNEYFWPSMAVDINQWHAECQSCFIANNRNLLVPPLKPILSSKPYEIVGLDVLELGPTTSGNRYALVAVDHFSKWLGAYAIPDKKAKTIAEVIIQKWICEGARCPKEFLSDQGSEFVNAIIEEMTKLTGIKWKFTKGYNPRENGLTERANRTIIGALKKRSENPAEWDRLLPYVVMAYNTSVHETTGESPFFLLHGFDQEMLSEIDEPKPVSLNLVDTDDYRVELIEGLRLGRELAQEKLTREREKMKRLYDERWHTSDKTYPKVGERVYMKVPAEKASHHHPKLIFDVSGPYRVLETSDNSALIAHTNGKEEPLRVQFDLLLRIPDVVKGTDMTCTKKRGRKCVKVAAVAISNRFIFRNVNVLAGLLDAAAISTSKEEKKEPHDDTRESTDVSPRMSSMSTLFSIPASSPLHLCFVCDPSVKILVMGILHPCHCKIQRITLGEVYPEAPEAVAFLSLTSLKVTAGLLSVLTNPNLSDEQRVTLIIERPEEISLTESGLRAAFRIFFSFCRHFEMKWKEQSFVQNVKFESVNGIDTQVSALQITNAFRQASAGWNAEAKELFQPPPPKATLLLVPQLFRKMADMKVEGAEVTLYHAHEEVKGVLCQMRNSNIVLLPKSQLGMTANSFAAMLRNSVDILWENKSKLLVMCPLYDSSFTQSLTELARVSTTLSTHARANEVIEFHLISPERSAHSAYHYSFSLGLGSVAKPTDSLARWQIENFIQSLSQHLKGSVHAPFSATFKEFVECQNPLKLSGSVTKSDSAPSGPQRVPLLGHAQQRATPYDARYRPREKTRNWVTGQEGSRGRNARPPSTRSGADLRHPPGL